jgi:hypothetical protein
MTDNVVDLIDKEEAVYRARLAGKSPRRIAHEFNLSITSVQEIIERQSPTIDNRLRLATIALDLDRLDELQTVFYRNAADGDVQAAAVLLKVQERRASLLGLNCPASVDPVRLPESERPNSTELLLAELNRIANERPAPTLNLITGTPCPAPEAPEDDLSADEPPTPPAA